MSFLRTARTSFDNGELLLDSGLRIFFHFEKVPSHSGELKHSPLLFLHGRGGHSGTWRKNLPYFVGKGWTTVAITLPRSEGTDPTANEILEYAVIAHDTIRKLGFDNVEAAIGNSMGGWVAMQLVISFPSFVNKLVLEDTAGIRSAASSEVFLPTIIIWGNEDTILPVENAVYLKSKIRNSILVRLENMGHVPHWESPDEFNQIVDRFLEGDKSEARIIANGSL